MGVKNKLKNAWNGLKTLGSADKNSSLSRKHSTRGTMKRTKKKQTKTAETNENGLKLGFMILNSDYSNSSHSNLKGVQADGVLMEEMLTSYHEVVIVTDTSDIEKQVKELCEKYKNSHIECLHFHYSGHGMDNATIEVDSKKKATVTPSGDCLVGCNGSLYSVHDLKQELLKCNPARLVLTLDCCRNSRGSSTETVRLRYKKAISNQDQQRIAVIYGTSDLHTASDTNTFTHELHRVYTEESGEIPILEIVRRVNQSWADRKIEQMCKHDIGEVGNNWNYFMWPTANTIKAKKENIAESKLIANKEKDEKADKKKDIEDPVLQSIFKRLKEIEEKQSKKVDHSETDASVTSRKRKQATLSRIPSKSRKTAQPNSNYTTV